MARIQILELPVRVVGEYAETPFALVIDEVDTETTEVEGFSSGHVARGVSVTELRQDEADQLAHRVGAVGAILVACTLDVV